MTKDEKYYKLVRDSLTWEEDLVYADRIELMVNLLHNQDMRQKFYEEAKQQCDWAFENIRIGSLVKTNCNMLIHAYRATATPVDNGTTMSHSTFDIPKGSLLMLVGPKMFEFGADERTGESLTADTEWHIKNAWLYKNTLFYTDIHPCHLDLDKQGSGAVWGFARNELITSAAELPMQVTVVDYDSLPDLWTGNHVNNPVELIAILP